MARIITINTAADFKKAAGILDNIGKKMLKNIREGMIEWGRTKLVPDMRESVVRADIRSKTGRLMGSIKWKQAKDSNVGFLNIVNYGVALDRMKPHFVNINRRRSRFLAWARVANSPRIRLNAKRIDAGEINKFGIKVRKHPFINHGIERAKPKLNMVLRRKTRISLGGI